MVSLKTASKWVKRSDLFKKFFEKKDFPRIVGMVYNRIKFCTKRSNAKDLMNQALYEERARIAIKTHPLYMRGELDYDTTTGTDGEVITKCITCLKRFDDLESDDLTDILDDYLSDEVYDRAFNQTVEYAEGLDNEGCKSVASEALDLVIKGHTLEDALCIADQTVGNTERERVREEEENQKAIEEEDKETLRWLNAGGWHTAYGLPF